MAGKKNPWGKPSRGPSRDGDAGGEPEGDAPTGDNNDGPRNPWLPGGAPNGGRKPPRRSASIEDIFKNRGPEGPRRSGGGGGGPTLRFPQRPGGGSWLPIALAGVAAVWLIFSSVHFVQPGEAATVTRFGGKYVGQFGPGTNFSAPYPISVVDTENVIEIRTEEVPTKLILTGDQNLVDLSYSIRWNIKDLTLFQFQLADPIETVREAAETAMRSSVAEKTLDSVISGEGRADIQENVRMRMQSILDGYGAGIAVQGIEIDKTDPPESVVEAFNDVLAAQQDAERELNRARRYAQQVLARAEGDAEAFNQIYAEYRLAPEVTRRRLYYETMEAVLSRTDKTVIDADGVTPYIPLREVERGRTGQSAAPAGQ
ncbi:protease modulator HflK [Erythrobacter sp.]|jgi:membrane protease subunit HflK|uniref:protease modulator HflK n=1 Tax=Erythrobacter sp. TaxID=1042 RepID=UPI002E9A6734|nr:protease modulator HflK [Erythrobacter sp.]